MGGIRLLLFHLKVSKKVKVTDQSKFSHTHEPKFNQLRTEIKSACSKSFRSRSTEVRLMTTEDMNLRHTNS